MAGSGARLDRIATRHVADRFAHWRRGQARLLLAVIAVLLALAAFGGTDSEPVGAAATTTEIADTRAGDDDLALYDRIIARVAAGENYYRAAAAEHRAGEYPLRPGLAVRLPTLALLHASLGGDVLRVFGFALLGATVWAWWRRMEHEPGGERLRLPVAALVVLGGSPILSGYYLVLHEFWTGLLIALSLGLHRPGKWRVSLVVAALALALRELALPYALLMGALALWRRDWREGAGWLALVIGFGLALALHLDAVAALALPTDPQGPGWFTLAGLSGWLGKLVAASNLRLLPYALAAPLALVMVLGWAGRRTFLSSAATLLLLGYGLAFMIAGRVENFYWGAVIAPVAFLGLAFAPQSTASLWRAAFPARAA